MASVPGRWQQCLDCHGGHPQDVVLKTWGFFVNPRHWLTRPCSVVFIAVYNKYVILLSKWVTLNAAPCICIDRGGTVVAKFRVGHVHKSSRKMGWCLLWLDCPALLTYSKVDDDNLLRWSRRFTVLIKYPPLLKRDFEMTPFRSSSVFINQKYLQHREQQHNIRVPAAVMTPTHITSVLGSP